MLSQPTPVAPAALFHVEDSYLWIELVRELARGWPEVNYTGCAQTLQQARDYCLVQTPAVLLLDLRLPDGDALVLAEELKRKRVRTKIILCTARVDDVVLYHFDRLMLDGFLWKESSLSESLQRALATVFVGGRYFPPELSEQRRRQRADPKAWFKLLSDREQALLPLLGQGGTDTELAQVMKLSPDTVHSHRQSIMRKLGLHRTVELVHWAQRMGFVQPVGRLAAETVKPSFSLE